MLADVLGFSDQTIARRYRRLSATFGLHVTGVVNGARLAWVDWCLPGIRSVETAPIISRVKRTTTAQ